MFKTKLVSKFFQKQIDLESARIEAEELRSKIRAKEDESNQMRKQSTSDDSAHNREVFDNMNQGILLI